MVPPTSAAISTIAQAMMANLLVISISNVSIRNGQTIGILTHGRSFQLPPPKHAQYVIFAAAPRIDSMTISLSIVVPAYNEGARLAKSLRDIASYLQNYPADSELIVVDDGSTDHTADTARQELAASQNVRTSVISYKSNLGKGRAVRLGLLASRSDIALFTDADLSTPITETPKLIDPIARNECDLAFGSRALDRTHARARHGPRG